MFLHNFLFYFFYAVFLRWSRDFPIESDSQQKWCFFSSFFFLLLDLTFILCQESGLVLLDDRIILWCRNMSLVKSLKICWSWMIFELTLCSLIINSLIIHFLAIYFPFVLSMALRANSREKIGTFFLILKNYFHFVFQYWLLMFPYVSAITTLQVLYNTLNSPPQLTGWKTNDSDPSAQSWKGITCQSSAVVSL